VAASRLLTDSISDAWRRHCVMGLAVAMLTVLAGCGGGGSDSPTEAPVSTRPVTQTDLEIAQLLYIDNRRTPQGFYQETAPSVSGYVATTHIKSTDVVSPSAPLYELCTDDWNTALAWSDQVATGTQASNLVETNTTTRYYEFGRVRAGTPPGYIRARVYRCTYLDRSSVDLSSAGSVAGQFNQRPLNATELQQLSEYLWQFTSYNNYGNAVLKSSGTVASSSVQHTLIIASLTAATSSGGCDRIRLIGWTHAVDSQTGALSLNAQSLWDFGARRTAGVVEICNPS
jgi:hypothetical protein